jgi:threonine/homoserine/homoserine lactone efflux protein
VAAAALQVYRERVPGARVTLAVLFLAEIAFGAAAGGKQSFIITILAVAIPFSAARRRVHKGLLAFTVLTFLLIIIPFNQAYRSAARGASGTLSASQALDTAPGILGQTIRTGNVTGVFSSSAGFLLTRIREIDSPAIIMQRTPGEIGFLSPAQLVEAPVVTLVPRAVWPGKPILDTGYEFSQTYYELPATIYSSSAVTPVGDLYRHGGWIPVIVGMFLLGCGIRLLDDVLDVSGNPHSMFLFLLLFPSLVKQEDDWVGMVAGIPGTLLVWLLAIYLTFRKRARTFADAA